MIEPIPTSAAREALSQLANGIIPADERDAGAASVQVGARIADRLGAQLAAGIYGTGLKAAEAHAQATFGKAVTALSSEEIHQLLAHLSESLPAFFCQLRADVCSLYLSDPDVWKRIGFPGTFTEQGGHPDFDRPQP